MPKPQSGNNETGSGRRRSRPHDDAVRTRDEEELASQMEINEEQLEKLEDLLIVYRIRALFFFCIGAVMLIVLVLVAAMLLLDLRFDFAERYSTLVNIGAIFLFFGLIETFSFFASSFAVVREVRRLIRRQLEALELGEAAFAR